MQTLQTSGEITTTFRNPINKGMSERALSMREGLSLKPLSLKKVLLSIAIISILALASCDDGGGNGSNDNDGENGNGGSSSTPKTFTLTYVGSVNDNNDMDDEDTPNVDESLYQLTGAVSVNTAVIGATTYLFVAGYRDDGVGVFSVDASGELTHVDSVDDADQIADGAPSYQLKEAFSVTTAVIAGTTYLFVAGKTDDGVSVFSVDANTGKLTHVDSVDDTDQIADNAPPYELKGAISVANALIGDTTYLFVAGQTDNGVNVFKVDNGGKLIHVGSVDDADQIADNASPYELKGAISVTTAVIGTTTYLFVAGQTDNGVSVFSVDASGELTHVDSVDDADQIADDSPLYELEEVSSVTTAVIGTTTYLFVAGSSDNGTSVFSVDASGELTHVDSVDHADNDLYKLEFATSVDTAVIGDTTYLFVTGQDSSGVNIFSVANTGELTHITTISDNRNKDNLATPDVDESLYQLGLASSTTTAVIGTTTYLFVAGSDDSGISVFKVSLE